MKYIPIGVIGGKKAVVTLEDLAFGVTSYIVCREAILAISSCVNVCGRGINGAMIQQLGRYSHGVSSRTEDADR